MIVSTENAEHYIWGEISEGWHLLKRDDMSVIQERVPAGGAEVKHYHTRARQFFYILEGVGTMVFDDQTVILEKGQGMEIAPQVKHQFKNQSNRDVHFLVMSVPTTRGNRINIPTSQDSSGSSPRVECHDMKQYRFFDLIMAVFVTVLVVSNIASSAKIVDWGFSLFGRLPMAFDAGTILFPVSYIFGDILTEVYGYKHSRRVIWAGFVCLAISAVIFWVVQAMPGEVTWQGYAGDAAYNAILGGMSSGGIVLGSLAGYLTGEFTNSFTLAKLKVLTEGRWLWMRTIGSTIFGQLVDTVMFVVVASAFGVFPWSLFLTLTVTNYIFKCGVEALMTPLTYIVVNALKKAETEDYYDRDTNFNPFTA